MTVVPNFLLKRLFVKNSLRAVSDGVAFDMQNIIGPGTIQRINSLSLDGDVYRADEIMIQVEGKELNGAEITDITPAFVPMNQTVTMIFLNAEIEVGKHKVEFDIVSAEGGHITMHVEDHVSPDRATPSPA